MSKILQKPRSMRAQLFALSLSIILIMSVLCSVILLYEYHSINALTSSLETINTFNRFSGALTQFEQTFNLYANSLNRSYLQDCHDLLDQLIQTSQAMTEEFPGESPILDNQLYIETYVSSARTLLAEANTLSEPQFWDSYSDISQQLDKINDNARHVQFFYLRNVFRLSEHAIELWNIQLRVSLIIVGVSLLLLLIFISRFIKSITTPVMHLVHSAKRIAQGDFSHSFTPLPSTNSEEIMLLTNTFAYMADTITKQMNALKDKIDLSERLHTLEMQNINIQLSLTEKEMYLMQSMINPHFLFNCLGTVSSMAILENAPRTQDISTRIARYLRSSIDLVGSRIPLSEEIKLLNQYIYIQSIRFGDRIAACINCDPCCEAVIVPAMLLQPIVENSIVHGLRTCLQGGKIDIAIFSQDNEHMHILIKDNGSGIDPERLEHLRTTIHKPFQSNQDCIGLHSVISQLDIMFDKCYTIEIESTPGQGTQTQIILPMQPCKISGPQKYKQPPGGSL